VGGSRFLSHLKWWLFTVPLLALVIMPLLSDPALFKIPAAEVQSVTAAIGQARADEATERANSLFRQAFVDSGLMRKTIEATSDVGLDEGGASSMAHGWVRHFWTLIYRVVYRATVMKVWLIGTLAFSIAAFVDGTVRRKIKAAAAGFASPLSFHLAAHGVLLLIGATVILLIARCSSSTGRASRCCSACCCGGPHPRINDDFGRKLLRNCHHSGEWPISG
jgi:Domain of unknown function (DUF4400)